MEQNWNGYDAPPVSATAIANAKAIVNVVSPSPEVFPTANQSVQLEYTKPNGEYLELEVTDDAVYALYQYGAENREWKMAMNVDQVVDTVAEFFTGKVPCTAPSQGV